MDPRAEHKSLNFRHKRVNFQEKKEKTLEYYLYELGINEDFLDETKTLIINDKLNFMKI